MTCVCISLLLFFALLLSQCAAAASAEDVLLMHRWSFNENLYDSVGGVSKTAAIGGGATLYQNAAKFKCGDYDTNVMNEGYVLLPPNVTEGISNSSSVSLEMWVDFTQEQYSWSMMYHFSNTYGGTSLKNCMLLFRNDDEEQGPDGQLIFWSDFNGTTVGWLIPNMTLDGMVGHFVQVYDASIPRLSMYLNGTRMAYRDGWIPFPDYFSACYLGKSLVSPDDKCLSGQFDEFRVWRGALSQSTIVDHFEAGPNEDASSLNYEPWDEQAHKTITFPFTGDFHAFFTPTGVASLAVHVYGAQGADDAWNNGPRGGMGGYTYGNISIVDIPLILLFIGGVCGANGGGIWGWAGYPGPGPPNVYECGQTGGGASDIRIVANDLDSRLIVSGGGGGAGGNGNMDYLDGGNGGGLVGANGVGEVGSEDNVGGTGGTQTSGGQQRCGSGAGTPGLGGFSAMLTSGGGGGSGLWGGSGGCWSGAGGGSSYVWQRGCSSESKTLPLCGTLSTRRH